MMIKGTVWKFGDNIDTDVIIPAQYLNTTDSEELALHCMENYDAQFVKEMNKGDIVVAGNNFGCGSSREHAPIALKAAGVSCVIAKSFARIFYRNAINIGLPIFESVEVVTESSKGDILEIDLVKGIIKNLTKGKTYSTNPMPDFIQKIISLGGLKEYLKIELERKKKDA